MNDSREPAFWPWCISLLGCVGVVGYFISHEDHITAFAVIALVLSALSGYCMMASRLLCWYAGFVVAALLTSIVIQSCRPALTAWMGTSGFVLSVIVTGIIATFGTAVALRQLIVRFFSARRSLEVLNRWAGFAIGASQGAILCGLVLGGLLVLEPIAKERLFYAARSRDHKAPQVIATKVVAYARQTRESAIGPTVAQYNPFRILPSLQELRDDLLDLCRPLTRTRFNSERTVDEHYSAR
jgi:hypothetical protein